MSNHYITGIIEMNVINFKKKTPVKVDKEVKQFQLNMAKLQFMSTLIEMVSTLDKEHGNSDKLKETQTVKVKAPETGNEYIFTITKL